MGVSTKKGDSGYTGTLRGKRVPKFHLIIEASGIIDESNSLVGLARASTGSRRIKRILLHIQKQLFVVGAELSASESGGPLKNTIHESDVLWLERLIEEYEETLSLPPGFVAFGQDESASHLDVARTSIRRAERIAVKMKGEQLIKNPLTLKYLNRLSDLLFVIACYEERGIAEKHDMDRRLSLAHMADPRFRRWFLLSASIVASLVITIALILVFHGNDAGDRSGSLRTHLEQMDNMHE